MDPATATLSHSVFGPGPRRGDGGLRSQAEGIVESLPVYTWPAGKISNDAKLAVLAFMTNHGRSESVSPSAWATWTFTMVVLAFPEFKDVVRAENDREYTFTALPAVYITAIVRLSNAAEDYDDENPAAYDAVIAEVPIIAGLPEIPRSREFFPPNLAATATVPAVYGYVALLVFMAGKKISEQNSTTITERRPGNLRDAYNIPEAAQFSLLGEGKMNSTAHQYVNQSWVTYSHMRAAVISEVARFSSGVSLSQRVVYTLVKMMEYSGMQQATFIHEFLQAMPQAINYSCIRPSYNAYIISVREVAEVPSYLQPYYKIIHGERTRAFHRNSILNLSACATAYKKYVTPSMRNFRLGDGATQAVNMYDAEAVRKKETTLQGLASVDHERTDVE